MKQCVCQGVGMIDVHRPAHHAGDRMGRRQLLECVAEVSQVRVRGGDPEQATVLLHHVDAGPPVEGVHHQVHRPLRTQDIAKRTQPDVRIGQMVKHSGADHLVERASELADVLNRAAGEARDSPVDTSAGARACNRRLVSLISMAVIRASGSRRAYRRGLRRAATGDEDLLVSP